MGLLIKRCGWMLLLVFVALPAHAALIVNLDGAVQGAIDKYSPEGSRFGPSYPGQGWFGANLYLGELSNETLTYSVHGVLGAGNELLLGGQSVWGLTHGPCLGDCSRYAPRSEWHFSARGELLPFTFRYWTYELANGSNHVPDTEAELDFSYWLGFERDAEGQILALILGVDDPLRNQGVGDYDFNDLMVRIEGFSSIEFTGASEVPLPGAAGLFMLALFGLGYRKFSHGDLR